MWRLYHYCRDPFPNPQRGMSCGVVRYAVSVVAVVVRGSGGTSFSSGAGWRRK